MRKSYEQTFFKKMCQDTALVPVLKYSQGRAVEVYKHVTLNLLLISPKKSVYHLPSTCIHSIMTGVFSGTEIEKCSGRFLWSVAVAPQAQAMDFILGGLLSVRM